MSVIACTPLAPSSLVKTGQPATSVQPPASSLPSSAARPSVPESASRMPWARRRMLSAAGLPSIVQIVPPSGFFSLMYSPMRKPIV